MKKFLCLVLCLLLVSITVAFAKKNKGSNFNGATLVSSTTNETVLTYEINSYDFKQVKTPRGIAKELVAPNTGTFLEKGAPALLKLSAAVIIPDEAKMHVEVIDSDFTEIRNIDIAPSKGNLLRTVDPETIPYEYGPVYQVDDFYPGTLAEPGSPYIIRDFRGQAVIVNPFQYNPVTKVLRVYTRMTVKISPTGERGENIFNRREALRNVDPTFNNVYARHFLNYSQEEYTPLPDDMGNYLVICYSSFMDEMTDFVCWKQSIGYNIDLVDYSTIGSSSALKTYVSNYYNSNGLTFLLLVGDHAQVPTSSTYIGDSDNNYGYIVGSDHYLDIFVGRFSAETEAHVTTQVDRTIHYERDVLSSAAWFRHAIGAGSSEGPGHYYEYDYQHINYILDDLEGYGYITHTCHERGGSPTQMANLINGGAGTIFFCGHGTTTSWYFKSWQYTSSHVDALGNDNELPFIFSVACQVGNFKNNTCFCETWLRATHNDVPTGAVAHAGSTISQYWNPPMDAQDEMADLLVSTSGPKRTFGGVFVNGLFKMIDLNGIDGERMADTWTCFGDSSVQLRTPGTPQPLQCSAVENKESCKCFQGIQEAVDDPETLPGHTLLVHGGTYNENVVVNKALTIAGDQDKNQTIDGGSSGHVVTITAPGVTIKGFTIKSNGNHTGIRIESDSNVIYDNNIQDCREGIYLYSNTRGNVVTGNTITGSRMIGIILYSSTENWLYSNTVIGSPEFGEMGILINYSNTNKIYANIIQGNNIGIYLNGSSYNIIHHNNFVGNYASARILGTCIENQWDNGVGNYWSDHPCTDSNDDGICDASYYIPYGGGANDPYPLAAQWSPKCGNVNGDPKGNITIGDISYLIDYLNIDPTGTPEPVPPCAADVNGDGEVNQDDIDRLVDHLFGSGAPIVPNCCSTLVLPYLFLHPPL